MIDQVVPCPVCKGSRNDMTETIRHEEKTGNTEGFACPYCGGRGYIRLMNLATAQKLLGKNTVICLEPEKTMEDKIAAGKEKELWIFNPATGVSGRGDKKFFEVRLIDRE